MISSGCTLYTNDAAITMYAVVTPSRTVPISTYYKEY